MPKTMLDCRAHALVSLFLVSACGDPADDGGGTPTDPCGPTTLTDCRSARGVCGETTPRCVEGRGWVCEPSPTVGFEPTETMCDGRDNDCDGETDELVGAPADEQRGVCAGATRVCVGAAGWAEPDYDDIAGYEETEVTCDGVDNDCDGETDEELGTVPCGEGICAREIARCVAGVVATCDPLVGATAETCDGRDEDCDGATDEDLGTMPCGQGICARTIDRCAGGELATCDPLVGATAETCDGRDEDCDGATDEELAPLTCGTGACAKVVPSCVDGAARTCDPMAGASAETCDTIDNDCDGSTDEELGTVPCGKGICARDIPRCAGGAAVSCDAMLGAGVEVCDDLDNDCDGATDEGDPCGPLADCNDAGQCEPTWTCDPAWYGTSDGCDCGCGSPDPDCATPGAQLFGCEGVPAASCDDAGACRSAWTCEPSWYGTADGCDCECGAVDPDCTIAGAPIFGCEDLIAPACDPTGTCEERWTCQPGWYGTTDGCDCACGAPDPDCADEGAQVFGCDAATVPSCDPEGHCADRWTCDPSFYGTTDGCDCGCGATDPDCADPDAPRFGCETTWTVLVYSVADNNIEKDMVADLVEMIDLGGSENFRFVVQVDRSDAYTNIPVPGLGDWTSTKRLVIDGDGLHEVADLGETNMADRAVLEDFVRWGLSSYPADRYVVVLSDHGAGWGGVGIDESVATWDILTVEDIRSALADGMAASGVARLDLVGFDACLTASYEVAEALQPLTDYLLASEELEPGTGWDYWAFQLPRDNGATPVVTLAQNLIDAYLVHSEGSALEVTLSLVDLRRLDALKAAWDGFITGLHLALADHAPEIGRARASALSFAQRPEGDQFYLVDLGDFARLAAAAVPSMLATRWATLDAALTDAVVLSRTDPGTERARGLNVYFPLRLDQYDPGYDDLTWAVAWRGFLHAYFAAGAAVAPIDLPDDPGAVATYWDRGMAVLDATIPDHVRAAITDSTAWVGYHEEADRIVYLAGLPTWWWQAGLSATWDGEVVVVTQGALQAWGQYQIYADPSSTGWSFDVPFVYTEAGADPSQGSYVVRRESLSADGASQGVSWIHYLEEGAAGPFTAAAGATLEPLIVVVDGGTPTWTVYEGSALAAELPIDLHFEDAFSALAPGDLVSLRIDAFDFAGNFDAMIGTLVVTACRGVTFEGQCDGPVLTYCAEDSLVVVDCAEDGLLCGFIDEQGYYDCVP